MSKKYIAYGSNLSVRQMTHRCPDARIIGMAAIQDWKLVFRTHATIEPTAGRVVPVLIWEISDRDEKNLDLYEGCPTYYYKRDFLLPVWGLNGRRKKLRRNCIGYILHEYRMLGEPGEDYFDLLDRGYDRWGFEKSILTKAMEDSIGRDAAALWLAEYYGEEDEHE